MYPENKAEIIQDGNNPRRISRGRFLLGLLILGGSACAKKVEQAAGLLTATSTPLPPEDPTSTPTPEPKQEPTATPKPPEPAPLLEKLPESIPTYGVFVGQLTNVSGEKAGDILISRLPSNRIMIRINETAGCKSTPTFNLTDRDLTNPQLIKKGVIEMSLLLTLPNILSGKFSAREFSIGSRTCGGTNATFETTLKGTGLEPLMAELSELVRATGQLPRREFIIQILESNNGGSLPELSK